MMRAEDAPRVHDLLVSNLDEYYAPEIPLYFLSQWPRGSYLAVDFQGTVRGYIAGSTLSGGRASVALFCVSAPFRGRGIGSALLARLISEARMEGIRSIQLEVRTGNEDAIRFYSRRGFAAVEELNSFYNDGGNAIRMQAGTGGFDSRASQTVNTPSVSVPYG